MVFTRHRPVVAACARTAAARHLARARTLDEAQADRDTARAWAEQPHTERDTARADTAAARRDAER